jgi:uncharacterized protein
VAGFDLSKITGFQWDKGNIDKNWIRRRVTDYESEQMFFNRPLIVKVDDEHSKKEARYYALGHTDAQRLLFTSFTIRRAKIRVISSRDMARKERLNYETHEEKDS